MNDEPFSQRRTYGCCTGIKQAAIIVGIIEIVRTAIIFIGNIVIFAELNNTAQSYNLFGLILLAIGSCFIFGTVGVMIRGINQECSAYLVPHLVMQALVIGFYFYAFIQNIAVVAVLSKVGWAFVIFDIVVVICEVFFVYIVAKCYKFIRIRQRNLTGSSIPVQYVIPSVYSSDNSYQPATLTVPPPPYETVMNDPAKFGTMITSQNDKIYV